LAGGSPREVERNEPTAEKEDMDLKQICSNRHWSRDGIEAESHFRADLGKARSGKTLLHLLCAKTHRIVKEETGKNYVQIHGVVFSPLSTVVVPPNMSLSKLPLRRMIGIPRRAKLHSATLRASFIHNVHLKTVLVANRGRRWDSNHSDRKARGEGTVFD
jgi:hypothetical protein